MIQTCWQSSNIQETDDKGGFNEVIPSSLSAASHVAAIIGEVLVSPTKN